METTNADTQDLIVLTIVLLWQLSTKLTWFLKDYNIVILWFFFAAAAVDNVDCTATDGDDDDKLRKPEFRSYV